MRTMNLPLSFKDNVKHEPKQLQSIIDLSVWSHVDSLFPKALFVEDAIYCVIPYHSKT